MYEIDNEEFFIHTSMEDKRLYMTRHDRIKSKSLSPCCMGADDVDYEMQFGKNPEILEICGMNQDGLEHFVRHYGGGYRFLSFFHCQMISDFSPLEDLPQLESVQIRWNIRSNRLWDFTRNLSLHSFLMTDCKKMTLCPDRLRTAPALRNVFIVGGMWENHPMESLDIFANMPDLEHLRIRLIRLKDRKPDFLRTLPKLERFDFDAGMLSTEEIAWIVAKYPHLAGCSLCAYSKEEATLSDVRVCGSKKPGLKLPEQQARLDQYIATFQALVEKYRNDEQR
ncbi:MAG: hypothetical protein IK149_04555 [Oscillospiraceae bacterium]|nr:hypothetical protein [Oscillospiraceae bacterium]